MFLVFVHPQEQTCLYIDDDDNNNNNNNNNNDDDGDDDGDDDDDDDNDYDYDHYDHDNHVVDDTNSDFFVFNNLTDLSPII